MASLFEVPIENIKGIGENRGRLYRKLGIDTVGALIRFYPRTYEDWSRPTPIIEAAVGDTVCVKAVISTVAAEHRISGGKLMVSVRAADDTSSVRIIFFNNKYVKSKLTFGSEFFFYGKINDNNGYKEMVNPSFSPVSDSARVHPIYGQTAGLTSRNIEASVAKALKMLPEQVRDPIPEDICEEYSLLPLKQALLQIHFPSSMEEMYTARRRLIFEELLVLVLGLCSIKSMSVQSSQTVILKDYTEEFNAFLPFTLTSGQSAAICDCINDMMSNGKAMNRLVQGDVGCGKTMVAASCSYTVIKNGFQAAMMAPTEILARQHYQTLTKLFKDTDVNIVLLTGSLGAKAKRAALAAIADGNADLIVGTHALISEGVEFSHLGLVITDEQHRFGVRQRAALLSKGSNPHLMVMSATPIPRTLALMVYGDLDISVISELPPGRQTVDTFYIDSSKRNRAYNFLIKHIKQGRQCYVVCPAVENNEIGLLSVEEYARNLQSKYFKNYRVAFLHGKMKTAQKDEIMSEFLNGNIDVLVSTTVIEVGVDVPNAAVMMIENAERFGLSQLHQLRGRVGRGSGKSYCILVSDAKGDDAKKRLNVMCSISDGFKIADEDLKLRGPGDFFGSRQHGLPQLRIADLAEDTTVLAQAQESARRLLEISPDLSDPSLRGLRAQMRMLFGSAGGQLN